MPRSLTSLVDNVATPFGTMVPETGTTVILSDEEFALVSPSSISVAWTDNGQESDGADLVSAQADNVPALGATLTAVAPDAATVAAVGSITAANPAALTSTTIAAADADATYGQPEADLINELKLDYTALRVDYTAGRAEVVKLVTDMAEAYAAITALIADNVSLRTELTAAVADLTTLQEAHDDLLDSLTGAGKPMAT